MNGEEGDYSTFVLNGEWALLGMQNTDLIYSDKKSETNINIQWCAYQIRKCCFYYISGISAQVH